jgi:hypothetical protein
MSKVSLEQIMGGGLQEQFTKAFERVVDNLADPNTSFKEARKITIELKFTQNEARDDVSCAVSVKEKLAAQAPMQTAFMIGKDLKSGKMYAEEYGRHNHLKGQMSVDEMTVDPATGEVLEGQPKANANVIDLRVAASN